MTRIKRFTVITGLLALAFGATARANENEVRNAVWDVFNNLKAGNYSQLYDSLPDSAQKKIARDKFTQALTRARGNYEIDRMDVGAVRVKGDLAVVDTTLYGRIKKPLQGDGKIVSQQYLVKQNGRWRVATGDAATVNQFLKANPVFAKQFPVRQPHIYFKNERGEWIDVRSLMKKKK
jgi:hypothetical protein